MRRAFTLVELLVVVGLMGLLGTASVGGYRAMQRGMEERGVLQNVDSFVKAAFERAQIDRQPTAIYFWNEMVREESQDENAIIVGKAVAVRRQGRVSRVSGDLLYDEFADLNRTYLTIAGASGSGVADDATSNGSSEDAKDNTMFLYCLDNINGSQLSLMRSVVSQRVTNDGGLTETYLGEEPQDAGHGDGKMDAWAFEVVDARGVAWKAGMTYGVEFAEITLPDNYVFENNLPTSIENPTVDAGTIICGVGRNTSGQGVDMTANSGGGGGGSLSIAVYVRRPGDSGAIETKKVGSSRDPSQL